MSERRKIVFATDSDGFGGAEQMILTTLSRLDRRDWQPLLAHYPGAGLAPLLEGARRIGADTRALPRRADALGRVRQFAELLRAERPAIVHAHLNWPLACRDELLAAILARAPAVIATEHLFKDIPWRRSRLVQQALCQGVDRYVAVSRDLARQLRERLGLPARKIRVIHNGIPLEPFGGPPDPALRAALGGGGRPLLLVAARLDAQKGQRYLLEALASVPEAVALLAGDGPERERLAALAGSLGLGERVVFLGRRDDMPALLAACDVAVLPSLFEGLPLAVLEAMAAGRPVIATDVGGTGEAVRHGVTGLLVPPADPAALAGALRAVLDQPALARRLAEAGQARARREFSAEAMVERLTALYDEVLDAKRARRRNAA